MAKPTASRKRAPRIASSHVMRESINWLALNRRRRTAQRGRSPSTGFGSRATVCQVAKDSTLRNTMLRLLTTNWYDGPIIICRKHSHTWQRLPALLPAGWPKFFLGKRGTWPTDYHKRARFAAVCDESLPTIWSAVWSPGLLLGGFLDKRQAQGRGPLAGLSSGNEGINGADGDALGTAYAIAGEVAG